ncbi:MAG: ABC-type transport system involved in multi-copper enzyme maturation permease subunit [Limisphaerales bacterium]|jgi:ABC-type transport system involved in multi-copper enzyme maturation permease subunit
MNAWPVIERELRVRARQRSTMTTRFVAALIAGFVAAGATLILQDKYVPAEVGQHVFHLLTHVLLVLCLLIGSAATSDTLSSEKRDGTLDLLFLSNLSRFDIVLGKLASASLNGFFGLLACMPALAISISLGGVTQAEFWRTLLALINALFFALAAGMAISAYSRESANALIGALAVTFGMALAPVLLRFGLIAFGVSPQFDFSILSPWRACQLAGATAYQAHAAAYWQSNALLQFLSWMLLAIGARRVAHKEAPDQTTRQSLARVWANRAWQKADPATRNNPAVWLYSRRMPNSAPKWSLIAVVSIGCLVIAFLDIQNSLPLSADETIAIMAIWIWAAGGALKLWVAAIACQLTSEARRSGELEALLTTPMGDRKVILAHAVALRRAFKAPVLTLLIVQTVAVGIVSFAQGEFGDSLIQFFFWAALMSVLWIITTIDLFSIGWLGLWQGIASRTARLALFKTVLILMAAPWLWLLMPQVGWVLAILSPFYSMGIMGSAQAKLRSELSQALGRAH